MRRFTELDMPFRPQRQRRPAAPPDSPAGDGFEEEPDRPVTGGPAGDEFATFDNPVVRTRRRRAPDTPPAPSDPRPRNNDAEVLPQDNIGDIPPPPIPQPPIVGPGVGGIPGTEGGTLALPGTRGALPFRTPAFTPHGQARFGPGVPVLGGGSTAVSGLDPTGLGGDLSPEDAAEILRALAAGRQ